VLHRVQPVRENHGLLTEPVRKYAFAYHLLHIGCELFCLLESCWTSSISLVLPDLCFWDADGSLLPSLRSHGCRWGKPHPYDCCFRLSVNTGSINENVAP